LSGRAAPNSRADHAVRLLLGHSATWDSLSSEDHALLCALPAPHGPLLTWLESQLHEHGPQAWAALREGLQGHPSQALALQLMSGPAMDDTADQQRETLQELRNLVNRMLVEQLKMLETEAIEASKADPSALGRYRELQARRRALESAA
jgi:DNA primase